MDMKEDETTFKKEVQFCEPINNPEVWDPIVDLH